MAAQYIFADELIPGEKHEPMTMHEFISSVIESDGMSVPDHMFHVGNNGTPYMEYMPIVTTKEFVEALERYISENTFFLKNNCIRFPDKWYVKKVNSLLTTRGFNNLPNDRLTRQGAKKCIYYDNSMENVPEKYMTEDLFYYYIKVLKKKGITGPNKILYHDIDYADRSERVVLGFVPMVVDVKKFLDWIPHYNRNEKVYKALNNRNIGVDAYKEMFTLN